MLHRVVKKLTPFLLLLSACGIKGGTAVFNDAPPNGVLDAQGSIAGSGGHAISGTAEVFIVTGSAQIAFHVANYSSPAGTRYYFALQVGGNDVYVVQSKGESGNQTYNTPLSSSGQTWNAIVIRTIGSYNPPAGYEVGRANLTMTP